MKKILQNLLILIPLCLFGINGMSQNPDSVWLQPQAPITALLNTQGEGHNITASGDLSIFATSPFSYSLESNLSGKSKEGIVRFFSRTNEGVISLGEIVGNRNSQLGINDIKMNHDGTRIIVSGMGVGSSSGYAVVYEFSSTDTTWVQLGNEFNGRNEDQFGYSVDISAQGDTIAIGAPGFDTFINGSSVSDVGLVRVYAFDSNTSNWVQVSNDIVGTSFDEHLGNSVSLSANGNRLAVGRPFFTLFGGGPGGQANIYELNGSGWQQLGSSLSGEPGFQLFGGSLELTPDGSKVIVGTRSNTDYNSTGQTTGAVKVYEFQNDWVQIGSTLTGTNSTDVFGYETSINSDGSIIGIGSPNFMTRTGLLQVYKFNNTTQQWELIGQEFTASNFENSSFSSTSNIGSSISLSESGENFLVGIASIFNGSVNLGGRVHLYEIVDELQSPQIISPANQSMISLPARLNWGNDNFVEETTSDLHISSRADFGDTVLVEENIAFVPDDSIRLREIFNPLVLGETYYWRVRNIPVLFPDLPAEWSESSFTVSSEIDVPILLTQNDTLVEPSFTLEWQPEIEPNFYRFNIHFSSQSDFSDTVRLVTNYEFDSLNITITDPLPQGINYWRVQRQAIENPDITSEWAERQFTMLVGTPELITQNDTIAEPPFTLRWLAETNPAFYHFNIHFSSQPDFSDTVRLVTNYEFDSLHITTSDPLPQGLNYWRVQRQAIANSDLVSEWVDRQFTMFLDVPTFITENDTIAEPPFTLRWLAETNPRFYHFNIHFSSQPDFSDTVRLETNYLLDSLAITTADPLPQGINYWRLRRQAIDNEELFSEWVQQQFNLAIDAPMIITQNDTIAEPSFVLRWSEETNPDVFLFNVHFSSEPDFSDTTRLETNYTLDSLVVATSDPLVLGNNYWRVRRQAIDNSEVFSEWAERQFNLQVDVPVVVTPNEADVDPPFTLQWLAETNPALYHFNVQLSRQPDFSDTIRIETDYTLDSLVITPSDPLSQGTNYWRIRRQAIDNDEIVSEWVERQFTRSGIPTPFLITPNDTIVEPVFTLQWQEETEPELYLFNVQISNQPDFSDTVRLETDYSTNSLTILQSDSLALGNYYWRVQRQAIANSEITSEWAERRFSLEIGGVTLISPADNSEVELPINFSWMPLTPHNPVNFNYEIQISSNEQFADTLFTAIERQDTTTVLLPASLLRDSTYYARIRKIGTENESYVSDWSPTIQFDVVVNDPILSTPLMSETVNPRRIFTSWEYADNTNSSFYNSSIFIASDRDFSNIIYRGLELNGNNTHFPNVSDFSELENEQQYFWGVQRIFRTIPSLVSEVVFDSLTIELPIPTLISPLDNASIPNTNGSGRLVSLEWFSEGALEPARNDNEIQVAVDPDFSQIVYEISGSLNNANLFNIGPEIEFDGFISHQVTLSSNETYYWRVRETYRPERTNLSITSDWSESSSFYIEPDFIRLVADSVFTEAPSYVNVLLHALDEDNRGISTLESEDFAILEDGEPISTTETRYRVSKLDQIPSRLQTVLMLDNSLSIGEDNLAMIKEAAQSLIRNRAPNQEFAIFQFADQVEQLIGFTRDTTVLINTIENISLTLFSGTDLFSATLAGLEIMEESQFSLFEISESNMILFTDGRDLAGRATVEEVLSTRGNRQIYSIGVMQDPSDFDEPTLRQIGNAGTFIVDNFDGLDLIFNEVQERFLDFTNSFYWLNYSSARRAGETQLTAFVNENQNTGPDSRIEAFFNADGFYASPVSIVVNGSAEFPLGIDTLRIAGDDTVTVRVESVFDFNPFPLSFDISNEQRLDISATNTPFMYTFTANGVVGDTINVFIQDTTQLSLNLEKELVVIYSERSTEFNEVPNIEDQEFSIDENSTANTLVGTILATDPEGEPITFRIVSGNELGGFTLSSDGLLTVLNSSPLDFEVNPTFNLTVEVSDGNRINEAEITINLLDVEEMTNEAPLISDQVFSINENSISGMEISTIIASDPNDDPISFSILSGNELGGFNLSIEGLLTVSNSSVLDFEINPNFNLTVQVTDGEFNSEASITINLLDVDESVNQAPQIIAQEFSLNENSSTTTTIGSIIASDPDNDPITYSIISGNELGGFNLSTDGLLTVANNTVLDFEVNPTFNLTVQVTDGELANEAIITVNLIDVDESTNQAPLITAQTFSINENSISATTVGSIIASDPDGDPITYSILSGNELGGFNLSTDGMLTVANNTVLDFEVNPTFNLTVQVTDGELVNEAIITINLIDVDESVNQAPQILPQSFSIDENSNTSTTIGTVIGSDPEGDPITYSILSGNELGGFNLSTDGLLSVANSMVLDFEVNPTFNLTVQVTDGDLSNEAVITINLIDVDESSNNAPLINNQSFTVIENSPLGTSVGTVIATDEDGNDLAFSVINGNTNNAFSINEDTGELTVNNESAINLSVNTSFSLTVSVSDGEDTSEAIITITIEEGTITSISDVKEKGIVLYPNPTRNLIQIQNIDVIRVRRIDILDLSGKLVKSINENFDQIQISDLSSGIYQIFIHDENDDIFQSRIIKN